MPHKHFDNLKTKKLPDSEVEITGEISLSFLVECRKEAIRELNNRSSIAGFRPGKIPEDVLVKKVGELGILEETAEIALGREYPNIIRELKIQAIGRPTVGITKLAENIPLEFKMTVAVEPEFKLPDYKKIAQETKVEVGEKEEPLKTKEKKRIAIIDAIIGATEVVVPKVMIESELLKMMGQFKDDVSRAGAKWEDYLKHIKKTETEIKEEWKESAVKRAKAELIVAKIAMEEKIEPTEQELEHETKHLLEHYKDADPFRARVYVYTMMRNEKVLQFLENLK
jgi:FKBP-type peptidyl-prolyl cis-trans isomerase (trigger factor)